MAERRSASMVGTAPRVPVAATGWADTAPGPGEARAAAWLEYLPTPAMVLDGDERIVYANRALADLLGVVPAQLIGVDPLAFHFDEDREQLLAFRRGERQRSPGLASDGLRRGEDSGRRLRRRDGGVWHYRLQYREIPGDDGRVWTLSTLIATGMELAAQHLLQRRASELSGFFAATPAALMIRDARLRITHVNHAFTRLTGYAAHELIGKPWPASDQEMPATTPGVPGDQVERGSASEPDVEVRTVSVATRQGRPLRLLQRTGQIAARDGKVNWISLLSDVSAPVPVVEAAAGSGTTVRSPDTDGSERDRVADPGAARGPGSNDDGADALARVLEQRDALVREVHHRIKNNLQGVAGLLRQMAERRPEMADALDDIAGQVQAIAQVHGLHVRDDKVLLPAQMVEAIFSNLARNFGLPIAIESPPSEPAAVTGAASADWLIPEQEAVPIALVVNELGTNAIKHRTPGGRVAVRTAADGQGVVIEVFNAGALPAGFVLQTSSDPASGLGLVRAMLPRRGAAFEIAAAGTEQVVARLRLKPPCLAPRAARPHPSEG